MEIFVLTKEWGIRGQILLLLGLSDKEALMLQAELITSDNPVNIVKSLDKLEKKDLKIYIDNVDKDLLINVQFG